jgi:hypothetical protein
MSKLATSRIRQCDESPPKASPNSSLRLCQFSPTTPTPVNQNFLHIAVRQFPADSTQKRSE